VPCFIRLSMRSAVAWMRLEYLDMGTSCLFQTRAPLNRWSLVEGSRTRNAGPRTCGHRAVGGPALRCPLAAKAFVAVVAGFEMKAKSRSDQHILRVELWAFWAFQVSDGDGLFVECVFGHGWGERLHGVSFFGCPPFQYRAIGGSKALGSFSHRSA